MKKLLSIAMLCSLGLADNTYFIGAGFGDYAIKVDGKVVRDSDGATRYATTDNDGDSTTIKGGMIINNKYKLTTYYTSVLTIQDVTLDVVGIVWDYYFQNKSKFKPFAGIGYSYHMYEEKLTDDKDLQWDDNKATINTSSIDFSLGCDYIIDKNFFVGLDVLVSAATSGDDTEGFTYDGEHYHVTVKEKRITTSTLSLNYKF